MDDLSGFIFDLCDGEIAEWIEIFMLKLHKAGIQAFVTDNSAMRSSRDVL
jgi:hypothetical protein